MTPLLSATRAHAYPASVARSPLDSPELKRAARDSQNALRGVAHGLAWDKAELPGDSRLTEWMLWSMVHAYTILLIEDLIRRNDDGTPIFGMDGITPGFGEPTDALGTEPEPSTGAGSERRKSRIAGPDAR